MRDLTYRQALLEEQAEQISEKWILLRMSQKLGPDGTAIMAEMFQRVTEVGYQQRLADRRRAIARMQSLAGRL